jgi:tRNA pseudouridine55 synthase
MSLTPVTAHIGLPEERDGLVVLVDKPEGITSFGVVRDVRRALGVKKVGHAGTLDPMATGLLIVLVGRTATREQDRFMGQEKEYLATIRLGETTPSFDAETEVVDRRDASAITHEQIVAATAEFTGEILQTPPVYSAIKVGGERLYKKARRGEEVAVQPRQVRVDTFEVVSREAADVRVRIVCSKGTYVRSLARDLGEALGVGGHLVALRRTRIGEFEVSDALTPEKLSSLATA